MDDGRWDLCQGFWWVLRTRTLLKKFEDSVGLGCGRDDVDDGLFCFCHGGTLDWGLWEFWGGVASSLLKHLPC
jgi:hypothetical protein